MDVRKVIIVNDFDYVQGGASLVAIEMANTLKNMGKDVIFFCGVSNKIKSTLDKNIKVVSCYESSFLDNKNKFLGSIRGLYSFKVKKKMKNLISNLNPQNTLIFVHGWTKAISCSFLNICKKRKFKVIQTAHDYFGICSNGGLFNYKKCEICKLNSMKIKCYFTNCDSRNLFFKWYRNIRFFIQNNIIKYREKIDYLITISDTSEKLLSSFYDKAKIVRIYNPTSILCKPSLRNVLSSDYYIYVGRVEKEKGIINLLEEFEKNNYKLLVVGTGSLHKILADKYESPRIKFVGWKNHDEVLELVSKSRAMIVPSLWYEGAPLTIFEASSFGIPCIVSKYCSGSEFVLDNKLIFDPKKYGDLNLLLNSITDNYLKEKSEEIYNNYWSNPFSIENYSKNLKKFIESI